MSNNLASENMPMTCYILARENMPMTCIIFQVSERLPSGVKNCFMKQLDFGGNLTSLHCTNSCAQTPSCLLACSSGSLNMINSCLLLNSIDIKIHFVYNDQPYLFMKLIPLNIP